MVHFQAVVRLRHGPLSLHGHKTTTWSTFKYSHRTTAWSTYTVIRLQHGPLSSTVRTTAWSTYTVVRLQHGLLSSTVRTTAWSTYTVIRLQHGPLPSTLNSPTPSPSCPSICSTLNFFTSHYLMRTTPFSVASCVSPKGVENLKGFDV